MKTPIYAGGYGYLSLTAELNMVPKEIYSHL
jgi:hypothetical protein